MGDEDAHPLGHSAPSEVKPQRSVQADGGCSLGDGSLMNNYCREGDMAKGDERVSTPTLSLKI